MIRFDQACRSGKGGTKTGRPSLRMAGEVLDLIEPALRRKPVEIQLTERRKHAILTLLLGAREPDYVARSVARLTYDPVEVMREVIDQVNVRAGALPARYAGPVKMRQAIAGWGEKERAEAAAARADVAHRHGLDPEKDFGEVERIRRIEEADLEAAQEAAQEAAEASIE